MKQQLTWFEFFGQFSDALNQNQVKQIHVVYLLNHSLIKHTNAHAYHSK